MDSKRSIKEIENGNSNKMIWSVQEQVLNNRPCKIPDREVPFKLVNNIKLKRSAFGTFLDQFNGQQNQNEYLNDCKLSMLNFDLRLLKPSELEHFLSDNDFAEDILSLLEKAVDEENVIGANFLYKNIHALKFVNLPMTVLDDDLRKYKRLQKLVLSGNLIRALRGSNFPRRLQYLELFCNDIEDLKDFSTNAPRHLIYLGLQRNRLHKGSHLHLLGECGTFQYLSCLDLAENDLSDLWSTLEALKKLSSLRFLQLQGNPCAVLCIYKDAVLKELPQLVYLDNTEILPEDRELLKFPVNMTAAITFDCHFIIGLPPPPKQKDVIHTFHLEVNMPLLEKDLTEPQFVSVESTEELKTVKTPKSSTNGSKSRSKEGKTKASPYDAQDEYESERKTRVKNTSFKTDRFSWAKVIQLPEEALVIQSLDGNLADIRDTFRSGVNVKLIYLQIKNPGKNKMKKAKPNKNKKEVFVPQTTDQPIQEIIMKKITLANFRCHLHSINWSDKTTDFFWADSKETNPNAAEVQGSLRAINYIDGGKNKSKKSPKMKNLNPPVALPKFFNIQVGFGLKRNY